MKIKTRKTAAFLFLFSRKRQTATTFLNMALALIRRPTPELTRESFFLFQNSSENKELCLVPESSSCSESDDEDELFLDQMYFRIEPYDREKNLYLENNLNFLFRRTDEGRYVAIGKLRDDILIELTYDEKSLLKQHGFGTG